MLGIAGVALILVGLGSATLLVRARRWEATG
jgi:hypothetical protein